MKKILTSLTILLLSFSLFASNSYFGINTSYSYSKINFSKTNEDGSELRKANKEQSAIISIDGGNYLDLNSFDIGIAYGASILSFTLPSNSAPSFKVSPYLALSGKYNFNETLFLSGMVGVEYRSVTGSLDTKDITLTTLPLLFDFSAGADLFSHLQAKVGLRVDTPIHTFENSEKIKASGYTLRPYVSLAVLY